MHDVTWSRIAVLVSLNVAALVGQTVTIDFDKDRAGKAPDGWTATQTGTGAAKWLVVQDSTAPSKPNVLKQSGVATYPVCLRDDSHIKNGFVTPSTAAVRKRSGRT
jgi:hypothetical protein